MRLCGTVTFIASRGLISSKLGPVYLSQLYIQIEVKCDLSHPPTFVWHWCEPYLHLCICGGVQRLNTSPLPLVLALLLTQKHALSLGQLSQWWSYRADGQGRCTLSITEVISIPPRDWKKLRVRERWRGPERKPLLTAAHSAAFTINYPHLLSLWDTPKPHRECECVF